MAVITGVKVGSPLTAFWTFPSVIVSSMLIGWAAEASEYFISQGMALAILAWLQTLPEFSVEAVIAWHGDVSLMTANFTGSLRLLVGLGWPLIYVTAAIFHRRKTGLPLGVINLQEAHCVEVVGLCLPILYFFIIYAKGTLNLIDAGILIFFYLAYIAVLSRLPPEEPEAEEQPLVPRKILAMKPVWRNATIISLFIAGGAMLYFVVDSFLSSMLGLAAVFGVSNFILVQWVAPFMSEFPEKVTAIYWAKRVTRAPMALMNMVSSNINQWTVLAGMIPIVYSISLGRAAFVPLDAAHRMEILLTVAQSLLGMMLLADMRFRWYEALCLFLLWIIQFILPPIREAVMIVYFGWALIELILIVAKRRSLTAFPLFIKLLRGAGKTGSKD